MLALIRKNSETSLEKREIAAAIRKRYPKLDRAQSEELAAEVVKQVIQAIRGGKDLATFERHANGDVEVNLFTLVDHVISQADSA
ncbi:hypothetical protein ACIGXA_17345 [Streptomyces fildesensis]|uniref:Uncharacterized protein n=1 Tax=Streptomyces fildesensis TaxID=375757 RepID=A0ABW8CA54_9ACTN